ncbi:hypothetical protein [Tautonia rosea]|uniref:hypothetical protein n=1 Tax=Tautonia rosea TaxID=2728037 RepID=UPI001474425F|nr:hypothetical protein [Tautonia rosea]
MNLATDRNQRVQLRDLPGVEGLDLHVSTLFRWASRGVLARDGSRVRLRTTRVGGRVYVRLSDFDAFNDRLNAESGGQGPDASERRRREIDRAEAELAALGV